MQDDKNKVETMLFTTGSYLGLEDISRLTSISDLEHLKKVINELVEDYNKRNSALEIIQQGSQWKLGIKKNYLFLTEKLLKDSELDRPTQETLAVVAYKSPVFQSDVIKVRGNKAYDHISILKDLDFITAEKSGRTRLLKVTQKFYDYFDVVAEQLKSKFEDVKRKEDDKVREGENTRETREELAHKEGNLTEKDIEKEINAEIKGIKKQEAKEDNKGKEESKEEKEGVKGISTEIFEMENKIDGKQE
jgi:segregation and condensation protein B